MRRDARAYLWDIQQAADANTLKAALRTRFGEQA